MRSNENIGENGGKGWTGVIDEVNIGEECGKILGEKTSQMNR